MDLRITFIHYLSELIAHNEKLGRLEAVLLELGVCHESDLVHVKAHDLSLVLTTIQAR